MNYHNITTDDMLNGEGLRTVLWVSGCSLKCPHCQNPETHNPNSGILFDESAKAEFFEKLSKDYISGATFSGGHPLESCNYDTILSLCKEIKNRFPEKTIWVYTGFVWEAAKDMEIMKYIDVLCDGMYVDKLRDTRLPWVGSSNQRVIDVQKSLMQNRCILYY